MVVFPDKRQGSVEVLIRVSSIGLLIGVSLCAIGSANAVDCRTIDPARERAALATFLKQNGYNQKQIGFSLRYADGKAKAWQKLPLTPHGEQCGVWRIGAMIYGCMVDFFPTLLSKRPDLKRIVVDKEFGKVTTGEMLAVGAASICQAGAIQAFADPRSW